MILTMNYCILLQKLVKFIYSCAITLQYALMYIDLLATHILLHDYSSAYSLPY